jgi:hypothetical protein
LIPETGLDLSLSNQDSGIGFWMILFIGIGLVGTGMVSQGMSNKMKHRQ